MHENRWGMTLIEVLLATLILGICVFSLMGGMSASLEIFRASATIHEAANVLAEGDAKHPMIVEGDPEEDLEVSADTDVREGWTYERHVEEDEDEDGLFVVRTKVKKGSGGMGREEEVVRLFYAAPGSEVGQ